MALLIGKKSSSEIGLGFKAYVILWVISVIALILFWSELPAVIKWPISLLEALFAPDFEAIKEVFMSKRSRSKNNGSK